MYNKLKIKLEDGINYHQYRSHIASLLEQGKNTGLEQTEGRLEITKLNEKRMDRLEKTISLSEDMKAILADLKKNYIFLVISEGWCADSAQSLPILQKMADFTPRLDLQIIFRDEHLDLMDEYLTNGGRAIPKLIAIEACEDFRELGTWGPRPEYLQKRLMDYKKNPDMPYEDFQKEMQLWYAKDKGVHLQDDFIQLFNHWEARISQPCDK